MPPPTHTPTVCLGLWMPDGQTGVLALLETGTTWDPKFRHLGPSQHFKASLETVALQGIALKTVSFLSKRPTGGSMSGLGGSLAEDTLEYSKSGACKAFLGSCICC